jgi:Tfp pilus assembly protein PilN
MKNISLLPAEVRNYRKASMKRSMAFLAGLTVLVMFLLAYLALSFAILYPQGELKSVRSDREAVRKDIAALKQYEDTLTDAKNREELIKQAMGDNPDWAELFAGIFDTMPEDMWLTGFNVKYEQSAGEFTMDGLAEDQASVSYWLSLLQEAEGITDVYCAFISRDTSDADDLVRFEIKAVVRQGGVYELPAEGGASR